MENIPIGMLVDFLKVAQTLSSNFTLEDIVTAELRVRQNLGLLIPVSPVLQPSPTVTPPSAASSPTVSISPVPDTTTVIPEDVGEASGVEQTEIKKQHVPTAKKVRRAPMSPTKTYSDCEKKHFLDVAYENNWGTTVAANKFNLIWGKGPTRRMFYWWREQFKRDYERDKKALTALTDRKRELSLELTHFVQNQENLLIPHLAERAKTCLSQLEAVDAEIEVFHAKKQKTFCSITGEKCTHGDGIQEENQIIRKFTTPYICEHCKMPFQKETTRAIHQKLCESRFVNTIQQPETTKTTKLEIQTTQAPPTYEAYNSELAEFTEQMLATLAATVASK